MNEKQKIGKDGDFYTSSSVHSVFAETLAHFVAKVCLVWNKQLQFCEMGAGDGRFAQAFMDTIRAKHGSLYAHMTYVIMEKSPYHCRLQESRLHEHVDHVNWIDEREGHFEGILFSNELVDAFPVHVIERQEGQLLEVGVTWQEELDQLSEILYPLEDERILSYLEKHQFDLHEGQRMEIPLEAEQWVADVAEWMSSGLWITLDYGYTHQQLMLPHHRRGSLLCYHHHRVDDNPLQQPGQKDMTAHVHFDSLCTEAERLGWETIGLTPQTDFLLMAGMVDLLQEHAGGDPFKNESIKKNRAIRQLMMPDGISGAFQALILAKGLPDAMSDLFQPFSFSTYK